MIPSLTHSYVRPLYGERSFAEVPGLIHQALGANRSPFQPPLLNDVAGHRFDQVIVILADAFGWQFFERFADHHPALQHFVRHGMVEQTTSQFPSTTAAHVTTISTGQVVGEHGVFEWQYYEPQLDAMITPLLFSFAGDHEPGTLQAAGIHPQRLFPTRTLFQDLQRDGVACFAFLPGSLIGAPFAQVMTKGAQVVGYRTLSEGLVNLRFLVERQTGRACHYLYFPEIDSICHDYGPDSEQVEAEVDAFLTLLERTLLPPANRRFRNTLLIVTADHGQTAVSPETVIYLNLHPDFERLRPLLRITRSGAILTPGGSARDLFLYIKDEHVEEAEAVLQGMLAGRADVVRTADLVEQGFFGGPVSAVFLSRLSNLVVLPHAHETVWWYEKDRFEQGFHAHHGGLSADEMQTPLLALTY